MSFFRKRASTRAVTGLYTVPLHDMATLDSAKGCYSFNKSIVCRLPTMVKANLRL